MLRPADNPAGIAPAFIGRNIIHCDKQAALQLLHPTRPQNVRVPVERDPGRGLPLESLLQRTLFGGLLCRTVLKSLQRQDLSVLVIVNDVYRAHAAAQNVVHFKAAANPVARPKGICRTFVLRRSAFSRRPA